MLRTTGATRRFTDEPVPDEVLHEILDDARFAPSGGNRQPWRVAVVRDAALRRRVADLMQPVWDEYVARGASGRAPFNPVDDEVGDRFPSVRDAMSSRRQVGRARPSQATSLRRGARPSSPVGHAANDLLDRIESVPVVLVVAADLRRIALMDGGLDRPALTGGASIYPFCWSILLAAHERGLGGVMTTFLSRVEPEAAAVVGLPEHHALAATLFLGVPERQVTRLGREPVASFATIDRFDGAPFSA